MVFWFLVSVWLTFLSICLSVYMSVLKSCSCICLSVFLSVCLHVCLFTCLSGYVSVCLHVFLFICLSDCFCLSVFLFICLLFPTSIKYNRHILHRTDIIDHCFIGPLTWPFLFGLLGITSNFQMQNFPKKKKLYFKSISLDIQNNVHPR